MPSLQYWYREHVVLPDDDLLREDEIIHEYEVDILAVRDLETDSVFQKPVRHPVPDPLLVRSYARLIIDALIRRPPLKMTSPCGLYS